VPDLERPDGNIIKIPNPDDYKISNLMFCPNCPGADDWDNSDISDIYLYRQDGSGCPDSITVA
jgi:hypothetical protein